MHLIALNDFTIINIDEIVTIISTKILNYETNEDMINMSIEFKNNKNINITIKYLEYKKLLNNIKNL